MTTTEPHPNPQLTEFIQVTAEIQNCLNLNQSEKLTQCVDGYINTTDNQAYKCLMQGFDHFLNNDFATAVKTMLQTREILPSEEYSKIPMFYSALLINAQLTLPKRHRPSSSQSTLFYENNINELTKADPDLANQIQNANWPSDFVLIDFWSGLHLYNNEHQVLMDLNHKVINTISEHLTRRAPIAFGSIGSGYELIFCLNNQYEGPHGMTRTHYLFEENAQKLKMLFHINDFSKFLKTQELLIFGGSNLTARFHEIFNTYRYSYPTVFVAKTPVIDECLKQLLDKIEVSTTHDEVKAYYESLEFQNRLKQIAAGEIQPRIMFQTCRWTTYLKHCAADFEKAVQQLGCQTSYIIEDNDVQNMTRSLYWQDLDEHKPDVVFMVSHARSSLKCFPPQLPFIGFIQDKYGPLATDGDLSEIIQPKDLFMCATDDYQDWLKNKGVPENQMFAYPVPADQSKFFPLQTEPEPQYIAEIGFAKHGDQEFEKMFEQFIALVNNSKYSQDAIEQKKIANLFIDIFTDLYNKYCLGDLEICRYENQMKEDVYRRIDINSLKDTHGIDYLIWNFYCTVYSSAWRYHFLEELDKAGIDLALYGNHWDKHTRLSHLGRGPVAHGDELNKVYNFNKISLSINHFVTMNPRVSECAMAGGFLLVAGHSQANDKMDVRRYFKEGDEIVLFSTAAELIDKTRYYLEHPQERQRITQNAQQRALDNHTIVSAATEMLTQWKKLL